MNKEEPYRDQAERLKQRIEKINDNKPEGVREQLPPREQIHREKRQKTKWKVKYPVIRMLVLSFILLPIIIFSVYSYLEGEKIGGPLKAGGNSSNYETINFEKATPENKENQMGDKNAATDESSLEIDKESVEVELPTNPDNKIGTPSSNDLIPVEQGSGKNSGTPIEPTEPPTSQPVLSAPPSVVISHTVKSGETLYRIAMNYFRSKEGIDTIKKANNIKNEQINVGQVLQIPLGK